MITIEPNFNNIKKATVKNMFAVSLIIMPQSINPKDSDYDYLIERYIKAVKPCLNKDDLQEESNAYTKINNSLFYRDFFRLVSLWDTRTEFNIKENNGKTFRLFVKINKGLYDPVFETREIQLVEAYDLVRSTNFTERDYSDEEDNSFWYDELEPSSEKPNIISINEKDFSEDSFSVFKNKNKMTLDIGLALQRAGKPIKFKIGNEVYWF